MHRFDSGRRLTPTARHHHPMWPLFLALTSVAWPADDPAGSDVPQELPIEVMPRVIEHVEASWPPEAKAAGLEAVVTLRITLDPEGSVTAVEVVGPAGNGFDEAATDAVRRMTWAPARTAAGPVAVVFDFQYGFVLTPEPPTDAPAPPNVEGTVLEILTGRPVGGVRVQVAGSDLATTTDAEGRFTLREVPTGAQVLHLSHPGHEVDDKAVTVAAGEVSSVKLWLTPDGCCDEEVLVTWQRPPDEVTRRTISIDEVKRIPGTFGDPLKIIQTLPGAARTPFGTALLVIRGADPEDSGVYIDGIRVPIIYHLTGTTSVLSPELIEAVDYLPGGYGVQYGRTMGGTIDVRTRTKFDVDGQLSWGTDILDSQVFWQGRPDKGKRQGLAVGVRRSYIDVFIPYFTADTGFTIKPVYWDYQAKWSPVLKKDDLSVFFYGFVDSLTVGTPADVAQGADQDTQGDLGVRYDTNRIVARWAHPVSPKLTLEVVPSFGIDSSSSGLGNAFGLSNANYLGQFRAQSYWTPVKGFELVTGTDTLLAAWTFEFKSAINFEAFDDPLAEREPVGFDGKGTLFAPDLYTRANLRPLAGTDRLLLSPGVRLNTVVLDTNGGVEGGVDAPAYSIVSLDPRVLGRYAFTDRGWFAIKGSTGIYHQPPQPQEIIGVGTQASVGYERSWSTSVGWDHRLSDAIFYDVDVFYRRMDSLVVFDENWTGFGSNPFVNGGDGRAYGVEFMARHDPVGPFFGWISYTLSRATRRDPFTCADNPSDGVESDLFGDGRCWYPFDFDQRHIFSAQAGYDLPYDFGISAQVQAVSGNPTDNFDNGIYDVDSDFYSGFQVGGYNDERLPMFFQTSLRFDRDWEFRKWGLVTYVDLINAVRGVNPEFTIYNYDYTEYAYVRGLPFIPNVGIEAKFGKR
jgi:TonB family protein